MVLESYLPDIVLPNIALGKYIIGVLEQYGDEVAVVGYAEEFVELCLFSLNASSVHVLYAIVIIGVQNDKGSCAWFDVKYSCKFVNFSAGLQYNLGRKYVLRYSGLGHTCCYPSTYHTYMISSVCVWCPSFSLNNIMWNHVLRDIFLNIWVIPSGSLFLWFVGVLQLLTKIL